MSEPETSGQARVNDPARFLRAYDDLRDIYRQFLDDVGQRVDKAFDLHKQTAALYERFILIDLGTISLSVTAITALSSKIGPLPLHQKHVLVWLIALAWLLLLLSAFAARAVIRHLTVKNKELLDEWSNLTLSHNRELLATAFKRAASSLSVTVRAGDEEVNLSDFFNTIAQFFRSGMDKKHQDSLNNAINKASTVDGSYGVFALLSSLSMQIGLLLLCIVAIKILFLL